MDVVASFCTTIEPEGSRTAVAVYPGPRIMTPSMTACPPTNFLIRSFAKGFPFINK